MAKIALISKNWTEPLAALIKALKDQRHEVVLITDRSTKIDFQGEIEVLSYFKNWTAWEALKLFPRIFRDAPNIWHFIFTNPKIEKPKGAHWMLAGLMQAVPNSVVASSIYGSVLTAKGFSWKPFLHFCDFVTLGTRESLMSFKRRGIIAPNSVMEVLPPLLIEEELPEKNSSLVDLARLVEALYPYFLIFSDRLPSSLKQAEILSPQKLLILGFRNKNFSHSHCCFLGEKLGRKELEFLAKKSKAILIAFDDLSVLELIRIQNVSAQTGAYLIVNPRQVELCPGLCIHKKTGWVIEPEIENLKQLLTENTRLTLPPFKRDSSLSNSVDFTMNELSRLYIKAMDQKI